MCYFQGTTWTPSKVITRLGEEINNPESICYWAAKNKIPMFSPALTDGSLGDMMFFHSYSNPGLVIDILAGYLNIYSRLVLRYILRHVKYQFIVTFLFFVLTGRSQTFEHNGDEGG